MQTSYSVATSAPQVMTMPVEAPSIETEGTLTVQALDSDLQEQVAHVLASEPTPEGELLYFRDAVLARAEVNANRDGITEDAIEELAATVALTAIDIEHEDRQVVGFFTRGRSVAGALLVDGVIFARRFPEVALGVVEGTYKLSIEAFAKSATFESGVRWLRQLKAIGGGVTKNPAGTATTFSEEGFLMIACKQEDMESNMEDNVKTPVQANAEEGEVVVNVEAGSFQDYLAEVKNVNERIDALAEQVQAVFASLQPEVETEEKEPVVEASQEEILARAAKLIPALGLETVQAHMADITAMSDALVESIAAIPAQKVELEKTEASQEEKVEASEQPSTPVAVEAPAETETQEPVVEFVFN